MYFKISELKSWGKRSAVRRRRFIQRFPSSVSVSVDSYDYVIAPYYDGQTLLPVTYNIPGHIYHVVLSNRHKFYVNGSYCTQSTTLNTSDGRIFYYYTVSAYADSLEKDSSGFTNIGSVVDGVMTFPSVFSAVEGISLAQVSDPDEDLPTGYPVWSGGAISIPGSTADDEERTGYPIGIADSLSGTLGLSQEDV